MITIIVAVSSDGVIGKMGRIPWRLPTDMNHFKNVTSGHTVVMGRRTWESLDPKYRPLRNRRNLILSRQSGFVAEGAEVIHSIEETLEIAEQTEHIFFMGGEDVYRQALPFVERLLITRVHTIVGDGDASFPVLDQREWNLILSKDGVRTEQDQYDFTIEAYFPNLRYIELANVRTFDQLKTMRKIRKAGHCPFCPENLHLYHNQPILWAEWEHWILTDNQWPYPGKNIHKLIILKQHAENLSVLSREAWDELLHIAQVRISGGAMGMRFGDPLLSGATVKHLHAQLISPKKGETTSFYIGADAKLAVS